MPDILFILLLALVIFGPKRLPEIARQVAKFVVQFRMMRDDLKRQLNAELLKIELEEKQKAAALPPIPPQRAPERSPEPQPQPIPSEQLAENSSSM
jgi:sec-independent protein translocase protein TatB